MRQNQSVADSERVRMEKFPVTQAKVNITLKAVDKKINRLLISILFVSAWIFLFLFYKAKR